MENDQEYDLHRKSRLAEHVALLLEGKMEELKSTLHTEVFDPEYFFEMHDEAFTAERVIRKDRYGPLVRRLNAVTAAPDSEPDSRAASEAEFEQLLQEMEALENEVFPIAMRRFERDVLNLAYGDPDLKSIPPDTREAFLDAVRGTMGDLVIGHTGIDPDDDGPYE